MITRPVSRKCRYLLRGCKLTRPGRNWHCHLDRQGQVGTRCRCHSAVSGRDTVAGLAFLSRLNETIAPALYALEAQEDTFSAMRSVQKELILALRGNLDLAGVATRPSRDGLTTYNTSDRSTSIALQVDT